VKSAPDWWGPSTKNEVTCTIFDYLIQIGRTTPGKVIPGPGWSYRAAHVQALDVVVYFVFDRSESIALKQMNCAFHDVMHNKLEMGNGMHALGGVAASPTPE
jgi:hypothetical protein